MFPNVNQSSIEHSSVTGSRLRIPQYRSQAFQPQHNINGSTFNEDLNITQILTLSYLCSNDYTQKKTGFCVHQEMLSKTIRINNHNQRLQR